MWFKGVLSFIYIIRFDAVDFSEGHSKEVLKALVNIVFDRFKKS